MAERIELEVATPERAVASEQVTDVQVPAANGYLTVDRTYSSGGRALERASLRSNA